MKSQSLWLVKKNKPKILLSDIEYKKIISLFWSKPYIQALAKVQKN